MTVPVVFIPLMEIGKVILSVLMPTEVVTLPVVLATATDLAENPETGLLKTAVKLIGEEFVVYGGGALIVTVNGVLLYITVRLAELCLLLLSVAVTVNRLFPDFNVMALIVQEDVPTQQ